MTLEDIFVSHERGQLVQLFTADNTVDPHLFRLRRHESLAVSMISLASPSPPDGNGQSRHAFATLQVESDPVLLQETAEEGSSSK